MKHIAHVVLMMIVAAIFLAVLIFVESGYVLSDIIVPPPGITQEEWLESFRLWGEVGIFVSLATALLWYVLGQWKFKVDDWKGSGKRPLWALLFFVPVAGIVLGIALTRQAQEGAMIGYAFYAINGLLSYYLETVLFSPSSFKYTPIGAKKLRCFKLAF